MELLVVVLIIGILSAVALPQYTTAVEKARLAEAFSIGKSIAQAQEAYKLANGTYTVSFDDLDLDFPCTKGAIQRPDDKITCKNYYFYFNDTVHLQAARIKGGVWLDLHYPNRWRCAHTKGVSDGEKLCKSLGGKFASDSTGNNALYYDIF